MAIVPDEKELQRKIGIISIRTLRLEAAMAHHWQQLLGGPADDLNNEGLDEAAYVASWGLSCAAVLGVVLLVWQFNV